MRREFKMAAGPIRRHRSPVRREILQITHDGHREVILVVADEDAVDVLTALCRAYQDGRDDRGQEDDPIEYARTPRLDTPGWTPPAA